jgi:two-component system KDP operon response regulator KdpE
MSLPSAHVLVIEDEAQIRRFVRMALEGADYAVSEAASLKQGMLQAGTRHPDLLILDLNLPDGDGIEVVKAVRTWSDMPILILSARLDESDKIQALDSGADDYLSKPFSVGELTARVRALLRRKSRTGEDASPLIEFGEVQVDFSKRTVLRRGEVVHLTPIEYKLLSALLSHPGKVITQKALLKDVWGPTFTESGHYLRIYVGHLRQKLESDPTQPKHFITEIGVGYRFNT